MMDTDHVKEKRFPCSFPGCSKRFTRAEHMHRHALNHTPGDYTCLECRAHFKRPDLLRRHLNRHRQKDLEASGSSVLNTRKRSWKTIGGDIVETRPYSDQGGRTSEVQGPPVISDGSDPPAVTTTDGSQQQQQQQQPWMANSSTFHDFAALEYDQIFQPDTASSFNMPYTTALDYNWLFNNLDDNSIRSGVVQETSTLSTDIYGQGVCDSGPIIATLTPPGSQDSVVDLWAQQQCEQTFGESNNSTFGSNPSEPLSSTSLLPRSMTPSRGSVNRPGSETVTDRINPQTRTIRSQDYVTTATITPGPRQASHRERERPLSMLERSFRIPQIDQEVYERLINVIEIANPQIPGPPRPVREHPLLSLTSLNTYLELYFTQFNTAYPLLHLPTFDPRTVEPLLLLSALLLGATYSSKDTHQLAVCVHDVIRPSIFAHAGFSARPELWTLQTILLVECFGKSRAGQTQHDMSHLFHGLLINLIRRSDCQSVRPEGPPPPKRGVVDQQQRNEDEESWRRWAQAEQKKRLALICFMCDTQHAVLFCQSLCMSAFELRVTLPCSQSIWEAPDAASWANRWRAAAAMTSGEISPTKEDDDNSVPFLAALKSYLTHQVPRPTRLTGLSRVLLLHGLMSVAWDMQRREQTALGVVDYGGRAAGAATGNGWRRIISNAYDTWKSDFDAHCARGALREDETMREEDLAAQRKEMDAFAAAYNTVYHAAQALLYMDFLDVQIYAGARHILGRPVQQKDYLRSSQVVRRWAANLWSGQDDRDACQEDNDTAAAGIAAWHAARLLLDATDKSLVDSSEAMGLFHVPWCLFLATLTCWAVHHARPRQGGFSEGSAAEMDQDDIVWDPEADMRELIVSMARTRRRDEFLALGKRSTVGLVWLMADELTKVRWGIIRSGVVVLRGLVPQRLINRYEEAI
ncbi:fungal-specific transcription factor domain-containing protein [Biscogniauxia mediterranea]|nr:fungal-specific transcription factor domain-containing protein [Biscogniauxia mediterranea]